MGCSTGEFAAITTGGSVDVLSVAQTFYEISTEVARTLPAESLADLRSLRILAPAATVMNLVSAADRNQVHLSADLGDEHTIFTGSAKAIDNHNNALSDQRLLPPLTSGHPLSHATSKRSDGRQRSSGQCRRHQPSSHPAGHVQPLSYPDDEESIRSFSLNYLFSQWPCGTIQSMYAHGIRKFIEVGPSGILSSLIPGILPKQDHLAVATNLVSKSGLTQIHHLLAALFVQEVPAKLDYLYQRREPQIVDWQTPANKTVSRGTPLL
jgi:hypothetical protein